MSNETRYVVMKSQACMPNSCWGQYARVAVVRVDAGGITPKIIRDTRSATVVKTWERRYDGGPRSAAARALAEAHSVARELNASVQAYGV